MRILLLLALLSACSKAPSSPIAAGKALFNQAGCASCHKVGEDGSAVGPDLTLTGFRHNAEWLDLFIKDPQAWKKDTLMPKRDLTPEARKAIVDYLMAQKGEAWGANKPWASVADPVAKGRLIYARAGCIGCHGGGGTGGYPNNNVPGGLIPKLDNVNETYTKAELIAKIAKGVIPQKKDASGPEPMLRMPPWGEKLDAAELDAVATYLMTLAPKNAEKAGF